MTISISVSVILLIFNSIIAYALLLLFLKKDKLSGRYAKITVVSAAKNEEKNIARLINSLKNQDYPSGYFEVIVVDDNSSDTTFKSAAEAASGFENCRVVKIEAKKLPAKKGALLAGVEMAKYPNILITDADCETQPGWLKAFSEKFDYGFDLIFGIAPLIEGRSFIGKVSAFENLRSSILTFSAAGIGFPYSAAARSFGFTKIAFDKLGGYNNTLDTTGGDDDLLIREAVKAKLNIGTVTSPGAFVFSDSENDSGSYLKQKQRHTKTSHYYTLGRKSFLSLWHMFNIIPLMLMPLAFYSLLYLIPLGIKILVDILMVSCVQKKFGHSFAVYRIPALQISYEFLLIVNFFNSFKSGGNWK